VLKNNRNFYLRPRRPVGVAFAGSGRGSADEEPFIYGGVDLLRLHILVLGNVRKLVWGNAVGRLGDREVGPVSLSGS
jgi:hypothetical protein